MNPGEKLGASPDGKFQQVKDSKGDPTGVRIDASGHPVGPKHPNGAPPHAHRPDVTGNNQPSPIRH